jgi:hypothetical protein
MSKPGDWMKSTAWLANVGHFLFGYAVILTAALWTHRVSPVLLTTAVLFLALSVKEFWIDLKYESGETLMSSTADIAGYTFGIVVGWIELLFQSGIL